MGINKYLDTIFYDFKFRLNIFDIFVQKKNSIFFFFFHSSSIRPFNFNGVN